MQSIGTEKLLSGGAWAFGTLCPLLTALWRSFMKAGRADWVAAGVGKPPCLTGVIDISLYSRAPFRSLPT